MHRIVQYIMSNKLLSFKSEDDFISRYKDKSIQLLIDSDFDVFLYDDIYITVKVLGVNIKRDRVVGIVCEYLGKLFYCNCVEFVSISKHNKYDIFYFNKPLLIRDVLCDLDSLYSISKDLLLIRSIIGKLDYLYNRCNQCFGYEYNDGTFSITKFKEFDEVCLKNNNLIINVPFDFGMTFDKLEDCNIFG